MSIQPDGPAPYAPASAVIDVVLQHRDRGLPTPITTEVIGRAGVTDALAPRVMKALTLFDLVDGEGHGTDQFTELAQAAEPDFKDRFAAVLKAAYADVFQYVNPATDPPERIRDQFRHYRPRGQQERMVTLFMGLCEYSGLAPEGSTQRRESSTSRQPRQRAPRTKKSVATNSGRRDENKKATPPTLPLTDPKARYLDLLLKKAEAEDGLDAVLLDRIERVIGIPPGEPSTPDEHEGGER